MLTASYLKHYAACGHYLDSPLNSPLDSPLDSPLRTHCSMLNKQIERNTEMLTEISKKVDVELFGKPANWLKGRALAF